MENPFLGLNFQKPKLFYRGKAFCTGDQTNSPQQTNLENLTPETTYDIQARAVGGKLDYSDWSDPVSHMSL